MPLEVRTETVLIAIALATEAKYNEAAGNSFLQASQARITNLNHLDPVDQITQNARKDAERASLTRSGIEVLLQSFQANGITLASWDRVTRVIESLAISAEPTSSPDSDSGYKGNKGVVEGLATASHKGRQRLFDLNRREVLTLIVMTSINGDQTDWTYPSLSGAKKAVYAEDLAGISDTNDQKLFLQEHSGAFKKLRDEVLVKIGYRLDHPEVPTPTLDKLLEEILSVPTYRKLGVRSLDIVLHRKEAFDELPSGNSDASANNGSVAARGNGSKDQTVVKVHGSEEGNGVLVSVGNGTLPLRVPTISGRRVASSDSIETVHTNELKDLIFPSQVNLFNRAIDFDNQTGRLKYLTLTDVIRAAYDFLFRRGRSWERIMKEASSDLVTLVTAIEQGRQMPNELVPERLRVALRRIGPGSVFADLSTREIVSLIRRDEQAVQSFCQKLSSLNADGHQQSAISQEAYVSNKTTNIVPADLEPNTTPVSELKLDSLEVLALTQAILDFGQEGLEQLGLSLDSRNWKKVATLPTDSKRLKAELERDPKVCAKLLPKVMAIGRNDYSGRLANQPSRVAIALLDFIAESRMTPQALQKIITECKV